MLHDFAHHSEVDEYILCSPLGVCEEVDLRVEVELLGGTEVLRVPGVADQEVHQPLHRERGEQLHPEERRRVLVQDLLLRKPGDGQRGNWFGGKSVARIINMGRLTCIKKLVDLVADLQYKVKQEGNGPIDLRQQ